MEPKGINSSDFYVQIVQVFALKFFIQGCLCC